MDNYIMGILGTLIAAGIIALVKMGMTLRDLKGRLDVVDEKFVAFNKRFDSQDERLSAGSKKMTDAANSWFALANRVTYIEAKSNIEPPRSGS